jgi:cell division protein FtsN
MLRQSATGGGASPLLIVLLLIIFLGGGAFALNYFGVVHLWGKKAKVVTESMPPPAQVPAPQEATGMSPSKTPQETTTPQATTSKQTPSPTPDLTPTPAMTQPPATTFKPPTSTSTTKPPAATATRPVTTTPAPSVTPQVEKTKPIVSSSTTGDYVVQVASWEEMSQAKADVDKLAAAGFNAFVEDAVVHGQTYHRVRVGRYSSEKEAADAANQLQKMYGDVWVAKANPR